MDALKGHLDLLVLAVVRDGPRHGYEVIAELRRRSRGTFDLAEGSVYPVLHKLERDGLLWSRWKELDGRRRRVYRLTRRGRAALADQEQIWTLFARGVRGVLKPRLT